jgi:hypothetical protein
VSAQPFPAHSAATPNRPTGGREAGIVSLTFYAIACFVGFGMILFRSQFYIA